MKAFYYCDVTYRSLGLTEIISRYCDWILGVDKGPRERTRKLEVGIEKAWKTTDLLKGGTLHGQWDCKLDTRPTETGLLVRLVHRQPDTPARLWMSAIDIHDTVVGVNVRHAVGFSDGTDDILWPATGCPRIITDLLEANGPSVSPRDISSKPLEIDPNEATEFVSHVLVDRERETPYLVVSPTNEGRNWMLDSSKIARLIVGAATVAKLTSPESAYRLTKALAAVGLSSPLGCSDGGARLYVGGLAKDSRPASHPLWIRGRLEDLDDREGEVARVVHQWNLLTRMPPGFFHAIEEADASSRRLAEQRESDAANASGQIRRLRESARSDEEVYVQENRRIESELEHSRAREQELEFKLLQQEEGFQEERRGLLAKSIALELALESRNRSNDTTELQDDHRSAMGAVLNGDATPEQVLLILGVLYPSRVLVLRSAVESAEESKQFKYVDQLASLLNQMCSQYWEALTNGRPDNEARRCFGAKYAAKEASLTKAGKERRTFVHNGRRIFMEQHLKIGVADNPVDTIRVHFDWVAEECRCVIGYCGPHLDP
jgi:hypothetical protein